MIVKSVQKSLIHIYMYMYNIIIHNAELTRLYLRHRSHEGSRPLLSQQHVALCSVGNVQPHTVNTLILIVVTTHDKKWTLHVL